MAFVGVDGERRVRQPLGKVPAPFLRHQGIGSALIHVNGCPYILRTESPRGSDGEIFIDDTTGIPGALANDRG